jgi:acetate kinase
VAHRIVHGGQRFVAPCLLDEATLAALAELNPLAPLHQPHNLAGVRALQKALPDLPQVGCFDTAFHAGMPAVEHRLPIDRSLWDQGVQRYGFHGLSYQFVMRELQRRTPRAAGRVLMAHLGNGASLCAALNGASVATTMGFSALDGLMMGTRSGSVDPGVLLHLWRQGQTVDEVETLLYKRSGLKGVSGLSADMRTLRASDAPAAREAIELFTYRLLREAGALLAVLGGVDVIAFTGGIGEHDAQLREDLLTRLTWLGTRPDAAANHDARGDRSPPSTPPAARWRCGWCPPTRAAWRPAPPLPCCASTAWPEGVPAMPTPARCPSTWPCRAAAPTAPSPGACWTPCWRMAASGRWPSAAPAPGR